MHLTDEDIHEFIDAWKSDFGEALTKENARKHASALMDFCLLLERKHPVSRQRALPNELFSLLPKIE